MVASATVNRGFARLARRRLVCCLGAGLFVLLVRAALLPTWPIPAPSIYDEFSYQLQADTFAHGRLANPPHPLWPFFESIFVLQQPTYASRYPPAAGMAMALGQVLFGHPWYGVWLSCGVLMAALCWALQGWLPGRWALAGAAISLHLCLMTYWMNGYWGGAVAAIGGALVAGAFGRILHQGPRRWGWLLGAGIVILMLSRPFEGALLVLPVAVGLVLRRRDRQALLPAALCVAAGLAWLGYYNFRVTGNPLRMPYDEYYRQYETVAPLSILPLTPLKPFTHPNFEWTDQGWALAAWTKSRTPDFLLARLRDWYPLVSAVFGSPIWALLPILALPWLLRSWKGRWLAGLAALMVAVSWFEVNLFAHYPAPFQAVFLILIVSALRYSRRLHPQAAAVLLLLAVGYRATEDAWRILNDSTPDRRKSLNATKPEIEQDLIDAHPVDGHPVKHVVFVKYSVPKIPHEEWVYNPADIDSAPVVWAHDMGDAENAKLMKYYTGRSFWQFDPDLAPTEMKPYH